MNDESKGAADDDASPAKRKANEYLCNWTVWKDGKPHHAGQIINLTKKEAEKIGAAVSK